jgi:peptide/nickel transport system permease protein
LLAGFAAAALAVAVGGIFGTAAGAATGWIDWLICRPFDLLFALPWLYLLLAARASLPLEVPSDQVLLTMMLLLGLAGAGAPFRVARGVVLAARQSGAVAAARGLGASEAYLLRAHLLPAAVRPLAVQWLALAPQFVAAEVSLTFLGLGASEPAVSWGSLLAALKQYPALTGQWWLYAPPALMALVAGLLSWSARFEGSRSPA